MNLENPKDIQMLITSMVTQAYELNHLIPNIEVIFYRMFMSPITGKEERKGNDKENLLYGNIFAPKKISLTYFGYKSLLETLILDPKKKHFKKVIAYLMAYEDKEKIDPEIFELIVKIGVDQKYPVLLGQTMKYFISHGY